jgi:hypothetical protein
LIKKIGLLSIIIFIFFVFLVGNVLAQTYNSNPNPPYTNLTTVTKETSTDLNSVDLQSFLTNYIGAASIAINNIKAYGSDGTEISGFDSSYLSYDLINSYDYSVGESDLSPGTYYYEVTLSKDSNADYCTFDYVLTYPVDITKPTLALSVPDTWQTQHSVDITWAATTGESGLKSVEIDWRRYNSTIWTKLGTYYSTNGSATFTTNTSSEYEFRGIVTNNANVNCNDNDWSDPVYADFQFEDPTLLSIDPPKNSMLTTTVALFVKTVFFQI